ncbi:MAG: hypothetical protein R3F65_00415 [bacterium]|nr:hypothetical protein [Myxococcales bacterium]
MKVAFVSNSNGNLALLETALAMLVERHEVDRIVPVGGAIADVEAALAARRRRFPEEVAWTDPGYEDYVVAAVLEGVVETPPAELDRTELIEMTIRPLAPQETAIDIAGRRVGVAFEGEPLPDAPVIVSASPGLHGVDRFQGRIRVCPGQLRDLVWDEEPASCALVAMAEGQLYVGFLDLYGDLLEEAVSIEPG